MTSPRFTPGEQVTLHVKGVKGPFKVAGRVEGFSGSTVAVARPGGFAVIRLADIREVERVDA